jgi:inner membrane protein
LTLTNFNDEEIRPKLLALQSPTAQIYLSGSIDVEYPEEVTIESHPQLYPANSLLSATAIVKHGAKLNLTRCFLDKLMNMSIDVWGTRQLTAECIYFFE